jgi:hypothetical protein
LYAAATEQDCRVPLGATNSIAGGVDIQQSGITWGGLETLETCSEKQLQEREHTREESIFYVVLGIIFPKGAVPAGK